MAQRRTYLHALTTKPTVSLNVAVGSTCALAQMAANLLAYPVYLHFLGYGSYGLWLTLASVFNVVQFIAAGMNPSLTQAVAQSAARGRKEDIPQILFWSLTAALLFGCALFAIWAAAVVLLPRLAFDRSVIDAVTVFGPWLAILGAIGLAAESVSAIVGGLGRFHYTYAANALGQVLSLVVSAALLASGAGMAALPVGYAVSRGAALLMLSPTLYAGVHSWSGRFRPSLPIIRGLIRSSSVLLSGSLFNIFLLPLNRWFIAVSGGVAAVPVFDIGFTGSMQVRNVVEFGLRSLTPEAAAFPTDAKGGITPELRRLHTTWFRRTLFAGIALYGVVSITAPVLLSIWLRGRLAPNQATVLRMFLIASLFNLLGTPAYYVLIGLKRLRSIFWSYVIQAALNVGLLLAGFLLHIENPVMVCGLAMTVAMLGSTLFLTSCFARTGTPSPDAIDDPEELWTHV